MSVDLREFVDTNVLVYAHDQKAGGKHGAAKKLMGRLWESRKGALSVQILQEFVVTSTRKIPHPLSLGDARSVVEQYAAWAVHAPGAADVVRAIDLQVEYGVSFWDAMMLHSAKALSCGKIWSEDLNHGQTYQGIPVWDPFR